MNNYYIGLDIGTESVGWAVTDDCYNIKKFKGNAMWGIRLVDESKTADERRAFRSARRRVERDKFRLQCLEMLFSKEIQKVDPSFFVRLKESNYTCDDKSTGSKYSLFNDKDFSDYHYHKLYPTIYHLRKELIDNKNPHDIRLVYLCISHIIKNRGHFLFDSNFLGENNIPDFLGIWSELTAYLFEHYEIQLDCKNIDEVQDVLRNRSVSITRRKEKLTEIFNVSKKDEPSYSVLSLLSGATVNAHILFNNEELKETEANKITFSSGYDDKISIYESVFGDEFELIEKLKAVYDWAVLADILNDKKYISYAKCDIYKKHKADLSLLKSFVKKYVPNKYNIIFNENKNNVSNYLAYSGHITKGCIMKKCEQTAFLDFLKKQLPKEPPTEEYAQMYSEVLAGSFMPKIVSKDNSVIPMQVNRSELKAILKNASAYLDFLKETDEKGKSVADKILDIFSYRIPYYVGPLNTHSDKSWLVRTKDKIYPWNFDEVVDVDASAEQFIENLTNKCTYLCDQDVLPKNSLLYSKFTVLNELNNLKINGEEVSVELKQKIYNDLFLKKNKVTTKSLKQYLKSVYSEDMQITGIDGDFKNTLKVFRDFEKYNLTITEKDEIVKAITIFGDDKKLLKKRLKNKYSDNLTNEEINEISKLKYSGWGRLSGKFLTGIKGVDFETGEVDSIINFMWNRNINLMQLLSKKYSFSSVIKEENGEQQFTNLKKEIDNLYVSPKVKRPIYQSMKIVEEIVKIMGSEPKKIFIEVARGDGEKGVRKESRKTKLLQLYKSLKRDNESLYNSLNHFEENEFRRDALYLYYTQMGKCMYSGENIDVEDIFNRNLYDIDHIFPQSKIKDDSLDNRVLVKKVLNEEKGNTYPINQNIRNDRYAFWQMLRSKDLISAKKFDRLTRREPLTDDELSVFINRQIVETRQSSKAVAELLKKRYKTDVVYVKANLVSDFRKNSDFIKSRDLNDLHHAKDAYLNIVVGNVYDTRFTKSFIRGLQIGHYSLNCMYDYDIKDAWVANGDNNSMQIVKKTMNKNNIRFTRYSSKQVGKLFDQNVLKKGNGQVPVKKNSPLADIEKYGGYNKAASTYFAIVKFTDKKGNSVKSFVPVNLYNEQEYIDNPISYITQELLKLESDASNVEIINPCVKYNSLISINGFKMHISSKSGGGKQYVCKPAIQIVLGADEEKYIKKISKYLEKCKILREIQEITQHDGLSAGENLAIYNRLKEKLNSKLFMVKYSKLANTLTKKEQLFNSLSVYEQCVVLMEVLAVLHSNVRTGDLSLIGEGTKSGALTIGNKIIKNKDVQSFKIIHQSITGLYEQETELLN